MIVALLGLFSYLFCEWLLIYLDLEFHFISIFISVYAESAVTWQCIALIQTDDGRCSFRPWDRIKDGSAITGSLGELESTHFQQ